MTALRTSTMESRSRAAYPCRGNDYIHTAGGGRVKGNLEAGEGCDNRGMRLKIATFNAENLFTRARVIR